MPSGHATERFFDPARLIPSVGSAQRRYWQDDYADFAEFFFGEMLPEPHCTKPYEDGVGWAAETTPRC